jgi:hypothetical protein
MVPDYCTVLYIHWHAIQNYLNALKLDLLNLSEVGTINAKTDRSQFYSPAVYI